MATTVEITQGEYFGVQWVNEEGLTCSVPLYFDHVEGSAEAKILICRQP